MNCIMFASLICWLPLAGWAKQQPWLNCSIPDCKTIDCSSHQLTNFDCQPGTEPFEAVQKLMLQNNYFSFFSIADVENCFPNLKFINLIGNPLKKLECGDLTTALEVVYNCSEESRVCSPLKLPICCCYPHSSSLFLTPVIPLLLHRCQANLHLFQQQ